MRDVLAYAEKVARSQSTVLITGETGSGKEFLARYLHAHSPRAHRPMICINCAALPETLLEGELFGYERGAYTGAQQAYPGKIKLADGGTLLLDEVGDLTPSAQAKLLRVIEEREVFPLGARRSEPVDLRIVSATNQDLEGMVGEHRFRADLYFRLNVVRVHMPPLRERPEDVPVLIAQYLAEMCQRTGARVEGLSPDALACVKRYAWPGNVRELRNVVEALFIDPPEGRIELRHLPRNLVGAMRALENAESDERQRILSTLFATQWNKCRAAQQLNWSRMTLYRKLSKYHISKPTP